ncbi:MAG: hypothetical protein QF408_05390 [Pirellulales bacterium]|nr:hypothetical protein [Pirellulales bacterium]
MRLHVIQMRCIVGAVPLTLLSMVPLIFSPASAEGCSICSSISPTLCDEIAAAELAVLARYESTPEVGGGVTSPDAYKSEFQIENVIKGAEILGTTRSARVLFFPGENAQKGARYLVHGNLVENDAGTQRVIQWTTPIALSPAAIEYTNKMLALPPTGLERLVCAKDYLTSPEKMLRRDAFDEFGKAPFETLLELKPYLDADLVLDRIEDPNTSENMRKLYYTLLCICGRPDDLPTMKTKMQEEKLQPTGALSAIIACYLSLAGAEGLPVVEEMFLRHEDTNADRIWGAAITALRFHGQEAPVIDRAHIVAVFRNTLQLPQLGARVLSDLARWEDWSVVGQVSELFVDAEGDTLWIREPVVRYLLACPLPEAKKQLSRLQRLDPAAVENGRRFAPVSRAVDQNVETMGDRVEFKEIPHEKTAAAAISPDQKQVSEPGSRPWLWIVAVPVAAGLFFVVLLLCGSGNRETKK